MQSDPNNVASHEHGLIRVYGIDPMETDAFNTFTQPDYTTDADVAPWPLMDALGADFLDEDFIEVLSVQDLEPLGGLSEYLVSSNGVLEAEIAPYRDRLDAQDGYVLVVFSSAFKDQAQVLSPRPPLNFLATLKEDRAPVSFKPLPDESAKGVITDPPAKKKPSDAAMSGRVATIALLVMALLVWLMIWIAG